MAEAITNHLKTGTVLHGPKRDYTILKILGQGGFGITYLVEGTVKVDKISLKAKFAIKEHFISSLCERENDMQTVKVYNPSAGEVSNSLRAFTKEALRLQNLGVEHPNIVKINEVFEANNTAYYVMEYLNGETLDAYVRRKGALSAEEMTELMRPLIEAVGILHDNNIAHYDIKPQNIILAAEDDGPVRPTLIDFGLAKHYDGEGQATSTIAASGYTPGYAPVEQYGGISRFSPQCDVYSLAATMLYCLTGKTPAVAFSMDAEEAGRSIANKVSEQLRDAIVASLSSKATERPANAGSLYEMIYGAARVKTSRATVRIPEPPIVEPEKPKATNKTTVCEPTPAVGPTRKSRLPLIIGIAALFIAGAAGGYFLMNDLMKDNKKSDDEYYDGYRDGEEEEYNDLYYDVDTPEYVEAAVEEAAPVEEYYNYADTAAAW